MDIGLWGTTKGLFPKQNLTDQRWNDLLGQINQHSSHKATI
jgi:hypothetical protein